MIRLSLWQWDRYKWKVELVKTYESNSGAPPLAFPMNGTLPEDFEPVIHRKVQLSGHYDYGHQVIVTNKSHGDNDYEVEAGHFLLTPFIIDSPLPNDGPLSNNGRRAVIVSRGFIPFADRTPETWKKYDFEPSSEILSAVVKRTINPMFLGPQNPAVGPGEPFQIKWYYEEIGKMVQQLPYPVIPSVYLQRLGKPPVGDHPAEAISIEVPPSTHFGYTIEWALLAAFTLLVGFLLQAFPWYRSSRYRRRPEGPPLQNQGGLNQGLPPDPDQKSGSGAPGERVLH